MGGAIASPQDKRSDLPEKVVLLSMGNESAQESWQLFFSSLPRANNPRLSSSISSPLCLPSAEAHGKWLQIKFCALALLEALYISSHLSLVDKNPAAFHSWMLSGFLSQLWCCMLESILGFIHHTSEGKPSATEMSLQNFNFTWEPSQSSCTSSVLPTNLVVVKWFLLSVLGYSVQLVTQDDFSTIYL